MEVLLLIVAVLAVLLGVAGTVLPLLPGPPLVLFGLWLIAWQDGYAHAGAGTLGLIAVLAVLGWLADHFIAVLGVQRSGASRLAISGALLGGLLGLLGGLPGVILGPVVGAMAGELLATRHHGRMARAGLVAALSFVVATALKLGLVLAMLGIFALAWWH